MRNLLLCSLLLAACTAEPGDLPPDASPGDATVTPDTHVHADCGPGPTVLMVQWNYTADPVTDELIGATLNGPDYQKFRVWQDAVLAWETCHLQQTEP